jgi:hypothetical protein
MELGAACRHIRANLAGSASPQKRLTRRLVAPRSYSRASPVWLDVIAPFYFRDARARWLRIPKVIMPSREAATAPRTQALHLPSDRSEAGDSRMARPVETLIFLFGHVIILGR